MYENEYIVVTLVGKVTYVIAFISASCSMKCATIRLLVAATQKKYGEHRSSGHIRVSYVPQYRGACTQVD